MIYLIIDHCPALFKSVLYLMFEFVFPPSISDAVDVVLLTHLMAPDSPSAVEVKNNKLEGIDALKVKQHYNQRGWGAFMAGVNSCIEIKNIILVLPLN